VDIGYRAQYSFDGAVSEKLKTRMCGCCEVQAGRKKSVPVGEGVRLLQSFQSAVNDRE